MTAARPQKIRNVKKLIATLVFAGATIAASAPAFAAMGYFAVDATGQIVLGPFPDYGTCARVAQAYQRPGVYLSCTPRAY